MGTSNNTSTPNSSKESIHLRRLKQPDEIMFGMSQQQQVALIQQMAQLQLMNQAAGIQKNPNQIQSGLHPMTFPNMPGYVVIPQNQLAQLQQLHMSRFFNLGMGGSAWIFGLESLSDLKIL